MKAYFIKNEFLFSNDDYFDQLGVRIPPIEEREFTDDEIEFPKIDNKGKLVVDFDKKTLKLNEKNQRRKIELKDELKRKINTELSALHVKYPDEIKLGFNAKADEAEKLLAGAVAYTDARIIFAECQVKYNTQSPTEQNCLDLAMSIKVNSDSYKALSGKASGALSKYNAEIDLCKDLSTYVLPDVLLV